MNYSIATAISKAVKNVCHYKICAIGFNRRGEYLGMVTNRPRFNTKGGGVHAEIQLLRKFGKRVRSILLLRVTKGGKLIHIDPCPTCAKILKVLEIECTTVMKKD
jgi:tRNA(Arg) A34 adenosine deaminase TadA